MILVPAIVHRHMGTTSCNSASNILARNQHRWTQSIGLFQSPEEVFATAYRDQGKGIGESRKDTDSNKQYQLLYFQLSHCTEQYTLI